LEYFDCSNNQLTILDNMEYLTKLIKNNKVIINHLKCNFIDSCDYIELKDLFDNLIKCENYKICEYIEKIEKIITELDGFQKYVLK
jgi:glutathionyl-hydroquinone reductase